MTNHGGLAANARVPGDALSIGFARHSDPAKQPMVYGPFRVRIDMNNDTAVETTIGVGTNVVTEAADTDPPAWIVVGSMLSNVPYAGFGEDGVVTWTYAREDASTLKFRFRRVSGAVDSYATLMFVVVRFEAFTTSG